jgi:transposase-like protein
MPKPSSVPLPPTPTTPSPDPNADPSGPPSRRRARRTKNSRRDFSPAQKLRIVRLADACTERGQIEALLRREKIYSSLLSSWRKKLALHGSEGLASSKLGRKPAHDAKDARITELEKHSARLEKQLQVAQQLLELQKKVSELLSIAPLTSGGS